MTDQVNLGNPFAHIAVPGSSDPTKVEVASSDDDTATDEPIVAETEEEASEPEPSDVAAEETEEAEASDATDEAEEADIEAEDEEGEAVGAKTISYRWYGKDHEFDPFKDEAETARLIQLGMDYDKKTTLNDAITEGLVKYDTESGKLVAGTAFNDAKLSGANELARHLINVGVLEERNGEPSIPDAVLAVIQERSSQKTPDNSEKIKALEDAFYADQTTENFLAWQEAKIEDMMSKRLQTRDAETQAEAEKRREAEQTRAAIELAKSNIDKKADELKASFTRPDGSVDEEAWKDARDHAQKLTLLRDERGFYQYDAAMAGLERDAKRYAAITSTAKKATTPRRKGKTSPATPVSRPSQGKATAKKEEVKFDPNNPFAHIPIPT